ncbi:predicted protein [Uncinocarpus reesii 1704]|uniref:C3HC-type domain-containing protein n=1 Tax=Uncinocarpus reesii (strain UAMH 1704) TaxID=336963 RepID=C4JGV6_UNCRE|nr:uncharacterized protein UREG_01207 [Uncinocarpus reesii 1704]EEP76358.1 predicted protein [Uncinocarpus reesii 1704]
MSYALASKKRKFHRVLESLSSNNTAPKAPHAASKNTATTPKSVHPTIKRVRLTPNSEPDDTAVHASQSPLAGRSSTSSARPSFVPWDRDRFLERLETFRRVDRWSPKPDDINEVQWAKRGWSCVDVMRVECVGGCGHSVVVKLPDEIDELEEYDTEKMEERKQVHTIQRLDLAKPDHALKGLKDRYVKLCSLAQKLPARERIVLPENMNLDELIKMIPLEDLSASQLQTGSTHAGKESLQNVEGETGRQAGQATQTPINQPALSLALFGWDLCGDMHAGLASCNACFRRLGLWMYNPKEDGSSSIYPNLDVVNEHLDYCPWINAATQSGTQKKPGQAAGWEILERVIRNLYRRKTWSAEPTASVLDDQDENQDSKEVDAEARKAKDREWWARLRRVRQALQVKGPKKNKGPP